MTPLANALKSTGTGVDVSARAAEAIADALNMRGFDALIPTQQGTSFLQVTNARGALCQLTIYDSGVFAWEYRYRDSSRSDPSVLAAMITCILGGNRAADACVPVAHHPRMTLKGQVGRALAAQGMQVCLNVLDEDEPSFEVYAEIAIANPACRGRGFVCTADDGLICWHGRICDPDHPDDGLDLDEVTRTLARTLAASGLPAKEQLS